MGQPLLHAFVRNLYRAVGAGPDGALADADLVGRFITTRDEAAFELLVWRHGPLVLRVCGRLLRHEQDIEDAFQATFLLLARKAGSIARRQALAGWLYRTAYRVALRARAQSLKRGKRFCSAVGHIPQPEPAEPWRDLRPVLDEEVDRLPLKYRLPFVLCYLEGKTNAEAARCLGCPQGTVTSRLAWARGRLRQRLTKRGVTLNAGVLSATLAKHAGPAPVPSALVASASKAAAIFAARNMRTVTAPAVLAEGVLRTMFLFRLVKVACLLVLLGSIGAGAGALAHRALAQGESSQPSVDAKKLASPPKPIEPSKKPAVKPFENEAGYTWAMPPLEYPHGVTGGMYTASARTKIACSLSEGRAGELVVTFAHAQGTTQFRPVAFNEHRKRFLGCQPVCAGAGGVTLALYAFDPKEIGAAQVHYFGIEELDRKAMAFRTLTLLYRLTFCRSRQTEPSRPPDSSCPTPGH